MDIVGALVSSIERLHLKMQKDLPHTSMKDMIFLPSKAPRRPIQVQKGLQAFSQGEQHFFTARAKKHE